MLLKRTLVEFMEKLLASGIDQVELYHREVDGLQVVVRERKVEGLQESSSRGVGVRAVKEGRLAFSYTTDFSEPGLGQLREALESFLAVTEPDEHNLLAKPLKPEEVELQAVDDADAGPRWLADRAHEMEEAALRIEGVKRVAEARASGGRSAVWLANSQGVELSSTRTSYSLSVDAVAEGAPGLEQACSFSARRLRRELYQPKRLGEEAGRWAVSLLGGKPLPSGERRVVFSPLAGGQLLGFLAQALDGEQANMRTSFLTEKLGSKIASELLTLREDPFLPGGIESATWDGEGTPTRKKDAVESGVLKGFLHNLYSAHRAGVEPTGNARRAGYASLPTIGSYNLHIANGATPAGDLLGEVDEGLLVHDMLGSGLEVASGMFSIGARGWRIHKGKLAEPVAKVTIAAQMLDLLKDIDAVGNDLDLMRPYYSPTLRVKKMMVAGQ